MNFSLQINHNLLNYIALGIHIFTGALSLLFGIFPLISTKGSKIHKITGKVFVIAMYACCASGIVLAYTKSSFFLLLIGIFSGYLTLSGHLAILNKGKATFSIWEIVGMVGIMAAIAMFAIGIYFLTEKNWAGATVQIVFGIGLLLNSLSDYKRSLQNQLSPANWLILHASRIIGGYIASTTAFLVVNNFFPYPLLNWFAPNIILVPIIFHWTNKIRLQTK